MWDQILFANVPLLLVERVKMTSDCVVAFKRTREIHSWLARRAAHVRTETEPGTVLLQAKGWRGLLALTSSEQGGPEVSSLSFQPSEAFNTLIIVSWRFSKSRG